MTFELYGVDADIFVSVQVTLPSAAACPASSGANSATAAGQGTASSSAATVMASSAASGGQNTASSAMSNMSNTATKSPTGQSQDSLWRKNRLRTRSSASFTTMGPQLTSKFQGLPQELPLHRPPQAQHLPKQPQAPHKPLAQT